MHDDDLRRRVEAIADDHRSGATTITGQVIDLLLDAHAVGANPVAVAGRVCRAHPGMALVWHAAAMALRDDGVGHLERMKTRLARAPVAIARLFSDLVTTGHPDHEPLTLATVSASGTVKACLERVAACTTLHVICGEGRPVYEGRGLAAHLAGRGIRTTLCTDAALAAVVSAATPSVDAVLVGADAVTPRVVVNKCGTQALVAGAADLGVPAYVVAVRDAFVDGEAATLLSPVEGPGAEVWEHPPAGVRVVNPYFESVPVEMFAAFVTEAGAIGSGLVGDVCEARLNAADLGRLRRI